MEQCFPLSLPVAAAAPRRPSPVPACPSVAPTLLSVSGHRSCVLEVEALPFHCPPTAATHWHIKMSVEPAPQRTPSNAPGALALQVVEAAAVQAAAVGQGRRRCMVQTSNSGHQLLFPPANWCPVFAPRTTQAAAAAAAWRPSRLGSCRRSRRRRRSAAWTTFQQMALITSDHGIMCSLSIKWP